MKNSLSRRSFIASAAISMIPPALDDLMAAHFVPTASNCSNQSGSHIVEQGAKKSPVFQK